MRIVLPWRNVTTPVAKRGDCAARLATGLASRVRNDRTGLGFDDFPQLKRTLLPGSSRIDIEVPRCPRHRELGRSRATRVREPSQRPERRWQAMPPCLPGRRPRPLGGSSPRSPATSPAQYLALAPAGQWDGEPGTAPKKCRVLPQPGGFLAAGM